MIYIVALFAIIFLLFGPSLITNWTNYRHRKRLSARIPGDEGIPIFGNLFELGRDPETILPTMLQWGKSARDGWNGELVKVWLLHQTIFLPFTGEMLQHILESKEEISKGASYDFFEEWLGRGLLLEGGDRWRAKRKMLTPSFHFTMLMGYIDTMNRHTKILLEVLANNSEKEVNIGPIVKKFTLDVICDTAMGKDLGSLHQPDQPYAIAINKLALLGVHASTFPYLWSYLGRWLTGWQKAHDVNVAIAHNFTMGVIEERMELLSRGEVDADKRAFLDLLISEKERCNLSMLDMREEVDTFMFAGHDTTSAALGWTLWCLANRQDVQERAYKEVHEIFGNDVDRDCTKEDLSRLNYLDRCIKEALRLFPSVPFVGRYLEDDLQMGPHLLPHGSLIVISPYVVHRNERIYPNPEIYDPDRFLPENIASRHPYAYIPFSAGPRNCIGQKFAMQQLKIAISLLLRSFRFSSNRDFNSLTIQAEVVLKAGEGINVVIENR